jgi:hypothetical protein
MRSACVRLVIIVAAVCLQVCLQECHAYTRKKSVVQPRGLHAKSAKHNTFQHTQQLDTHDTPRTHDTPAQTELETHDTPAHTEIDVCEDGNLNAEGGRCQHERVVQHPDAANANSMSITDIFLYCPSLLSVNRRMCENGRGRETRHGIVPLCL